MRQRRFGDRAQAQRAHRDAELRARDHQRDLAHRPQRRTGPARGPREGFDDGTAGRDQRELGRHEERVAQQQQNRQQQGHGRVTRTCSMRRRSTSTTVNSQPFSATVSPAAGMCPSRAIRNPASVS